MSLKMILWGAIGVALLTLGLIVNDWREKAALVPVLEQRVEQANLQIEQERKQREAANAASKGYQDELASLRSVRAAAPARAVRLCTLPARTAAAASGTAEPGPDGGAAAPGLLPPGAGPDPEPGPDIGPDLYALADRADELSAQARGLQDDALRKAEASRPSE